jgi:hypothetical protein
MDRYAAPRQTRYRRREAPANRDRDVRPLSGRAADAPCDSVALRRANRAMGTRAVAREGDIGRRSRASPTSSLPRPRTPAPSPARPRDGTPRLARVKRPRLSAPGSAPRLGRAEPRPRPPAAAVNSVAIRPRLPDWPASAQDPRRRRPSRTREAGHLASRVLLPAIARRARHALTAVKRARGAGRRARRGPRSRALACAPQRLRFRRPPPPDAPDEEPHQSAKLQCQALTERPWQNRAVLPGVKLADVRASCAAKTVELVDALVERNPKSGL